MTNPIVVERMERAGEVTRRKHYYWCPGCDCLHGITIRPDVADNGAGWTFSGTLEKPTYAPSQLTTYEYGPQGDRKRQVCHTFIREGMIQYLGDCTHDMRGKTVPLPPLPDWMVKRDQ